MVYFAVTAYQDSKPEDTTVVARILGAKSFMAASAFVMSYVLHFNFF
jgi:hypothetical protein